MTRPQRFGFAGFLVFAILATSGLVRGWDDTAQPEGDVELNPRAQRLEKAVHYLASEELEGRGPGTQGIDLAADYLVEQFQEAGLSTEVFRGSPFQSFEVVVGSRLGDTNQVKVHLPKPADGEADEVSIAGPLKLGEDFNPLRFGGSGSLDLPVVFAGYGITAPDVDYDDYAGIDVDGAAVLVIRKTPQQGDPEGLFGADARRSPHAPFTRKISNAYQHGAKAIIFVTDAHELDETAQQHQRAVLRAVEELADLTTTFDELESPSDDERAEFEKEQTNLHKRIASLGKRLRERTDPVLPFGTGGDSTDGRDDLPVLHVTRRVADGLLRAGLGQSLAELEATIDEDGEPRSGKLEGVRLEGEVTVIRERAEVKNVVGILPGRGDLAKQAIVVGAHYDHIGYGGAASRTPGKRAIHHGADDNASGTAALVEVARMLSEESKHSEHHRQVVFIAFTAEEMGLLGSSYYIHGPAVPLGQTVAMINMDMVGWLRNDKLIVTGVDTGDTFLEIIDRVNKSHEFELVKKPGGFGPSDHANFYAAGVPVLNFFTDMHPVYHTPYDTADKLNYPGLARVAEFVSETAWNLATSDRRPTYAGPQRQAARDDAPQGARPYFGSIPDFGTETPGYALSGVAPDSPASRGGLQAGDVIVQFGEAKIGALQDFDGALRRFKAGDKVPVVVNRGGETVKLEVVLDPPR